MPKYPKFPSLAALADETRALYAAEVADGADPSVGLSPASAVATLAAKYGVSRSSLRGYVDPIYYRENGLRNPLPKSAAKGHKALARSLAARRRKGGLLARLDTLRATVEATTGRPASKASVEKLLDEAGVDKTRDYTGRGTRKRAEATRGDALAEVAESLA